MSSLSTSSEGAVNFCAATSTAVHETAKDTLYKNPVTEEKHSLLKKSCPGGFKIILPFRVEQLGVIMMHISELKLQASLAETEEI